MKVVLIMGVAGTGKTTIGTMLADQLGWEFLEGDNLHPASNRAKMESGTPLTDEDRWPWLDAIVTEIQSRLSQGKCIVAACSALKHQYRELLRKAAPDMLFVHLTGAKELIASRLQSRKGHFFPLHLLDSQLNTLETPHHAIAADITMPPQEIVNSIKERIASFNASKGE